LLGVHCCFHQPTNFFRTHKKIFFPWRNIPYWARASCLCSPHDHTHTHHPRYDSSGREISPTQRLLPDKTQHSKETDTQARAEIEPTISASERPQTDALDRADTVTGTQAHYCRLVYWWFFMTSALVLCARK